MILKHLKHIAIAAAAMMVPYGASALTAEDYCDIKVNAPKGIKEMKPMADGLSYTAVGEDGKSIRRYSYKTGAETEVLFSIDGVKGDLRIDDFDGYELSANERKILLWNDEVKIYRRSFTAQFYVYDIMRKTLKAVSEGGAQRCATISHDGRMVAFVRDNNIYVSNLEYGTENQVTKDGVVNEVINGAPDWCYEEEFGVDNTIRWSNDDLTLAFVRFDEKEVPLYSFDIYSGSCNPQPQYDLYPGAWTYKYPLAGFPNSEVSVWAYNLDNRTLKKMDLPIGRTDYVPSLEFDGSGSRLMAMILNRDQNKLALYSANPGSTVAKQIYTDSSSAWLDNDTYQMVSYEADGFVIASDRSGYRHLYKYDYSGALRRQLTKGDWNVTALYGKNGAGEYFVQTTQLGAVNRNVARVGLKGDVTMLNPGEGTEAAWFSQGCEYYVRRYSNAVTPPVYTLRQTKGGKAIVLEDNAEYAARYASAPKKELVKVPNADGQEMDAYVIKPTDFDATKKYPLMAYQYNGPGSQQVLNEWRMDGVYLIAASGYVVTCADGRGTGNRSRQWCDAVYKRLGHYETLDQIASARHFAAQPYIDSQRMACFGWSYGGYMTLMELTADGCPFKCGVSMAPVTDWRFYDSVYTERFMLTPQQNEAGYNAASALGRTDKLNARLLIMSGTADDNVHFYNTLKYTSKLTSEGKLFDMMAYTGFDHSLRMCNARVQLYRKIVDFLDTNLKH